MYCYGWLRFDRLVRPQDCWFVFSFKEWNQIFEGCLGFSKPFLGISFEVEKLF